MIFMFTVCTTLLRVFKELLGKTWNFTCQNLEIAGNNSLQKSKWVDQTRFCLILVSNRYVNLPILGDHFWKVWMGDLCISLQRFALLLLECYFLKTCALFLAFYQGITRSRRKTKSNFRKLHSPSSQEVSFYLKVELISINSLQQKMIGYWK